jgi:hypothetical protein
MEAPTGKEVAAMTAVNCPMCTLRFRNKNERDWHLNNEHHHPIHAQAPARRPIAWQRHHPAAEGSDHPEEPAEAEQ